MSTKLTGPEIRAHIDPAIDIGLEPERALEAAYALGVAACD